MLSSGRGHGDRFPGRPIRAVIFPNCPPRSLTDVGPPAFPMLPAQVVLIKTPLLSRLRIVRIFLPAILDISIFSWLTAKPWVGQTGASMRPALKRFNRVSTGCYENPSKNDRAGENRDCDTAMVSEKVSYSRWKENGSRAEYGREIP